MMFVFVCIVCICLYFLQQKLLVASIQTHSARYIQYIQNTSKINQKYNTNTYKYIQIHTPSTYEPTFFQAFFSVCILFVFVCIVSILIDGTYRYMSHTLELLCACMCMYCMYVHVFSVCISSSHIFLEENMSKVLLCTSHSKLIFAG
jgi:lipopolysaccharide export LptBFGC system permease protein LptF